MRQRLGKGSLSKMPTASERRTLIVGSTVVAGLIGYVDYITGPSVSLTLFYLAPVVGCAWLTGAGGAIIVALVAGLASLASDLLLPGLRQPETLVWNSMSRTVVLLIAAVIVNRVREDRQLLRSIDAQKTRSLQLLERGLTGPATEMLELLDHWDGGLEQLRSMLRPRAETIRFLARDFTEMIQLQRGRPAINRSRFDLLALVDELRAAEMAERRVTFVGPADRVYVLGDEARVRQSLAALVGLLSRGEELFLSLARHDRDAELTISSDSARAQSDEHAVAEQISLSLELAELMFATQGGSLKVLRNPITRSLRMTASLPLA
jgi:heme exporter protein D